jgi:hypothetical protein
MLVLMSSIIVVQCHFFDNTCNTGNQWIFEHSDLNCKNNIHVFDIFKKMSIKFNNILSNIIHEQRYKAVFSECNLHIPQSDCYFDKNLYEKKCNSILMHFKIQFWSSIIKQMEYGKEPHNKIGNEIKEIKS